MDIRNGFQEEISITSNKNINENIVKKYFLRKKIVKRKFIKIDATDKIIIMCEVKSRVFKE